MGTLQTSKKQRISLVTTREPPALDKEELLFLFCRWGSGTEIVCLFGRTDGKRKRTDGNRTKAKSKAEGKAGAGRMKLIT